MIIPAWQNRQPPRAPAEDLDVESVVHHLGEGNQLLLGVGPVREVGDGALLDDGRRGGIDRHGGLESTVGEVPGFVEGRHVDALDASEGSQDVEPVGAASGLPGGDGRVDLADHLLAVTQHHEVEEVGERLRVVGGVATGPDQRLRRGAIGRSDGHARRDRCS